MSQFKRVLVLSALIVTSAFSVAHSGETNAVSSTDRTFFKKAAIGGMTEVEAGKLAASRGTSDDVKSFGQKMVDDHTKANDELKALAASKGVTLPDAPDSKHQAMLDTLKLKNGADFDKTFISDMKKGHTEAIAAFKKGSKSKDPDVANFAKTTLPTLMEHQKTIPMTMAMKAD